MITMQGKSKMITDLETQIQGTKKSKSDCFKVLVKIS